MLERSLRRLLTQVDDRHVVLDVGGWAKPLTRADWVIDLMPYETRAAYGRDGEGDERFGPATWVRRDICDREPWPFADDQFDFAVCSHTLEDVRDPVWVCSELTRVARAGYIEVPSRLEEQSYGIQGPWAGWGHHRWLVDVTETGLEFVFKHHVLHNRDSDRFPRSFWERLPAERRAQSLWWEGGFECRERVFVSGADLDRYLSEFVAEHLPAAPQSPSGRLRRRLRAGLASRRRR